MRAQEQLRHRTGLSRSEQFEQQQEFLLFSFLFVSFLSLFIILFLYFPSYVTTVTLIKGHDAASL